MSKKEILIMMRMSKYRGVGEDLKFQTLVSHVHRPSDAVMKALQILSENPKVRPSKIEIQIDLDR